MRSLCYAEGGEEGVGPGEGAVTVEGGPVALLSSV